MRKIIILSVLAGILLTGCGANPTGYSANEDSSVMEDAAMTTTKTTETLKTIDEIDRKISEALDEIEKAKKTAISEIKKVATSSTTAATTMAPEPKSVELNVKTQRGDGTLTFIKAETRPATNQIIFYYETSDDLAKMPDIYKTVLIGKSGKEYKTQNFGGVGNKGDVWFDNITDFSDLSTVTLTYAFEGYEPVTVTFDIPGL